MNLNRIWQAATLLTRQSFVNRRFRHAGAPESNRSSKAGSIMTCIRTLYAATLAVDGLSRRKLIKMTGIKLQLSEMTGIKL